MTLIRYEYPNENISEFDRAINRAFSSFARWPGWSDDLFQYRGELQIPVDLYDDQDNYYVRAELPGVKKSDVKLELDNAVLTITAERKTRDGDQEGVAALARTLSVAEDIQADKIKAKLADGILSVTLPKSEEVKPRQISIS
jgi:HSP20 family protein